MVKVRLLNEEGIETALAVSVADVTIKVHCDGFAPGRPTCSCGHLRAAHIYASAVHASCSSARFAQCTECSCAESA